MERTLRRLVEASVRRHPAEALLLSGGLDTSVLAPLADRNGTRTAITVLVGRSAPDRGPSARIARELRWDHRVRAVAPAELMEVAPTVVRTLRTFEPIEVRNSLVIAFALRDAAAFGARTVMTGDAADELFAGYSFLWTMPPRAFARYMRRMAATMRFSSVPLGAAFGVEVRAPFADPSIVRFALRLPRRAKIGTVRGRTVGKLALRRAFPEAASRWRRKDPIEVGSGSCRLTRYFAARTPRSELLRARREILANDRVDIRDAEHLAYYRVFRAAFGEDVPIPRFASDPCGGCGYELPDRRTDYCRVCGAFPARRRPITRAGRP